MNALRWRSMILLSDNDVSYYDTFVKFIVNMLVMKEGIDAQNMTHRMAGATNGIMVLICISAIEKTRQSAMLNL